MLDLGNRKLFLKWKYAFSDSDLPSASHSELSGVSSLVNCIFLVSRKTGKTLPFGLLFCIFWGLDFFFLDCKKALAKAESVAWKMWVVIDWQDWFQHKQLDWSEGKIWLAEMKFPFFLFPACIWLSFTSLKKNNEELHVKFSMMSWIIILNPVSLNCRFFLFLVSYNNFSRAQSVWKYE